MIYVHNDDSTFAFWLDHHPNGYVVNVRGGEQPMLHITRCSHLYPADPKYGRSTKVPKACDTDRQTLEAWAQKQGLTLVLCPDCEV